MSTLSDRRVATTKRHPIKIVPIADIKHARSWAIYGRSGSGKTTFASTFPKPILLLDIQDQGTESIKDVKGIEVATIEEWEEVDDIFDMLDRGSKYKSVVFDTMTQLQLLCANWIRRRKKKPELEELRWGDLTRQEWGDIGAGMKQKITQFRNLDMEVVFIAQERTNSASDSDSADDSNNMLTPEVGAALSPATAHHLNASVSVLANMFIKVRHRRKADKKVTVIETTHSMRLGPNPVYTTKVRKPMSIILPDTIDNPTYSDIVDIIEGRE